MNDREYDDDNRGYLNPEGHRYSRYNSSMRNNNRYYSGSSYDERYLNPERDLRDYSDYETPRMNNGDRGWRGDDIYGRYDSPRSLDPYRSAWNDWTGNANNDAGDYYRDGDPGTSLPGRGRAFYTDHWNNRPDEEYTRNYSRGMRAGQDERYRGYNEDHEHNPGQYEHYTRNDRDNPDNHYRRRR